MNLKTIKKPLKNTFDSNQKFINNLISSYLACYKASKSEIHTIIKIKKLELEVKKLNLSRTHN